MPGMQSDADDRFVALLRGWCSGDEEALAVLLGEERDWICGLVRRRLGAALRGRAETQDVVQDAVVEVLRSGPRILTRDRAAFRALLARIVENTLRDAHDRHTAARRDLRREVPLDSRSTIVLDKSLRSVTHVSEAAVREEERALIRCAIELLEPIDREIVLLRGYRELEFAECARLLGIAVSTAQMRFARAVPRLARMVARLRAGQVDAGDPGPAPGVA